MFSRISSFANVPHDPYPLRATRSNEGEPSKESAPSQEQLTRWYDTLVDLLDRESDGDMDHGAELINLRDEIYGYLY